MGWGGVGWVGCMGACLFRLHGFRVAGQCDECCHDNQCDVNTGFSFAALCYIDIT